MTLKYSKQQIFTVASAVLFLIGAAFMLVNTFAENAAWSFWVGLGFAIAATGLYVLLIFENRKVLSAKLAATKPAETPEPSAAKTQEAVPQKTTSKKK